MNVITVEMFKKAMQYFNANIAVQYFAIHVAFLEHIEKNIGFLMMRHGSYGNALRVMNQAGVKLELLSKKGEALTPPSWLLLCQTPSINKSLTLST